MHPAIHPGIHATQQTRVLRVYLPVRVVCVFVCVCVCVCVCGALYCDGRVTWAHVCRPSGAWRACGLLHGTSTTTHSREPFLSSTPVRPHYMCTPRKHTHTHIHLLSDGVSAWCTHTQEREGERDHIYGRSAEWLLTFTDAVVFSHSTHTHPLCACPHFTRKPGWWMVFVNEQTAFWCCLLPTPSLSRCFHTFICAITYIHTHHDVYSLHTYAMDGWMRCVFIARARPGQDSTANEGSRGRNDATYLLYTCKGMYLSLTPSLLSSRPWPCRRGTCRRTLPVRLLLSLLAEVLLTTELDSLTAYVCVCMCPFLYLRVCVCHTRVYNSSKLGVFLPACLPVCLSLCLCVRVRMSMAMVYRWGRHQAWPALIISCMLYVSPFYRYRPIVSLSLCV
mmetsp:Transcript_9594/g.27683  ORF Transcript_9594/g.27683 Transcript_9594/m.27683 type:complete len:392 (-) Transcript_9594:995-2170(-)